MAFNNFEIDEAPCDADVCAVRDTLTVIGGKWKSIILHTIHIEEIVRFNQLKKLLPEISQKMLTQQLRELERDGLIIRIDFGELPARVEYSLSDLGKKAGQLFKIINSWQKQFLPEVESHRIQYDLKHD